MARIEPIPWEALPGEARELIQAGLDSGMYTTPLPMQIIAYSSAALRAMHDGYRATFRRGLLETRLVELLRLHSAQAGACVPCSASRKDGSVSEADVACLGDPGSDRFSAREAAALRLFDDLAARHHEIDDGYFRELAKDFSSAEIVELGYLCATNLGAHRFMHCLGIFAGAEPVLAFDPAEVDRSRAAGGRPGSIPPPAAAGSQNPVRLPPLEEREWSPSTRKKLLGSWLPAGQAPARPSTVRATLSRHEKLFEVWDPFGAAIFNGELPQRDREVLILRTAWLTRCRLQWAYHEAPAARAGLTSADIDAIIEGPESAALDAWDRVLVSVVDQLREHGTIDDATWAALAARYTTEQLIEVPMIAGHYLMIAYAVNSFGTPVPDGMAALPVRPAPSRG